MRLRGERGARLARALVLGFRPRPATPAAFGIVLTGFGPFPGVVRNATAEMIQALATANNIVLRRRSVHALDFIAGRGAILLPSGKRVRASLMVLPVVWQAAAALVAREARAARVKLVLMSGVAPLSQLVVEGVAVRRAVASPDVLGLKPPAWRAPRPEATLTVDVARAAEAARIALAKEPSLHAAVRGVEVRHERRDNAYICNATAYDVTALGRRGASMLATSGTAGIAVRRTFVPANGFVHWPGTIASEAAGASAHILLAMVDALAC